MRSTDDQVAVLRRMYDRFNAQDADGVLSELTEDVLWANAMERGHEHGRDAVQAYWARQWDQVRARVTPIAFRRSEEGAIVAEVEQLIFDREGNPVQGSKHGLKDKTVLHIFRFRNGKVIRFAGVTAEPGSHTSTRRRCSSSQPAERWSDVNVSENFCFLGSFESG